MPTSITATSVTSHVKQRHPTGLWANLVTNSKPRDDQPHVCPFIQGQRNRFKCNISVQKKICNNCVLQTNCLMWSDVTLCLKIWVIGVRFFPRIMWFLSLDLRNLISHKLIVILSDKMLLLFEDLGLCSVCYFWGNYKLAGDIFQTCNLTNNNPKYKFKPLNGKIIFMMKINRYFLDGFRSMLKYADNRISQLKNLKQETW